MTRLKTTFLGSGLAGCLLALGAGTWALASEQPPAGAKADALLARAAGAERAGQTNDAVAAYTLLLQREPALEPTVGPRLVSLLIGSGQQADALVWAARVARRHPEPAAYLAGVYGRLGQWKEAELLLRATLARERDAGKRSRLLWQLADVQESLGDPEAARFSLTAARDGAPDELTRATAERRLEAARSRKASLATPSPGARTVPTQPEGAP